MALLSETTKYTLYGTLFGLSFPVVSVVYLCFMNEISDTSDLVTIIVAAHKNSLLYVIDSAPLFLGSFAFLAGLRQDRIIHFSASLEQQVAEKTESLRLALDASKKSNEMIAHMAEHDSLTGLLNRRRFQKELEKWGQYALRYQRSAALIFLDLDKLKFVNDTYGHHGGDQYLTAFADLLRAALRNTDTIARWGGDEFAVLLPETKKDAAIEVANKLLRLFNEATFNIAGYDFSPSASLGVALFPDHGADFNSLVVYADAAMYEAKNAGRNCWRMYSSTPQETQRVQEQIQWEVRLRRALENDQFLLFYQPLLCLADNTTPGYEALLRMEDRDGQLISPGLFLESAERFGLSVTIDYMVIRKAVRRIASFTDRDIWVSLNLSRASLEDEKLIDHLKAAVEEVDLRPGRLHIEITAAAAMEYIGQVRELAVQLKAIGCRLVLDDFGQGSAYQFLQQFPVDMIKVDASLIRDLATQKTNQTLVKSLTTVAHDLGIKVVAKFVEDAAILDILRELNVDYAQGFAIGRPMESIEQLRSMNAAGKAV
jgi:diguanylate cyclase (GGDEF)-like protein